MNIKMQFRQRYRLKQNFVTCFKSDARKVARQMTYRHFGSSFFSSFTSVIKKGISLFFFIYDVFKIEEQISVLKIKKKKQKEVSDSNSV